MSFLKLIAVFCLNMTYKNVLNRLLKLLQHISMLFQWCMMVNIGLCRYFPTGVMLGHLEML